MTQVGEVGQDWFCVYLIPETLRVTTLGERREGQFVNIEIDAQTQVHALDIPCRVRVDCVATNTATARSKHISFITHAGSCGHC